MKATKARDTRNLANSSSYKSSSFQELQKKITLDF